MNTKLNALKSAVGKIKESNLSVGKNAYLSLSVDKIIADPENARKTYTEESIKELALTIAEVGLIQPITVHENEAEAGTYIVSQGSRRLQAVKWLKENMPENEHSQNVKCFVAEKLSKKAKLVENIQREDLHALEIANYLVDMIEEEKISAKELSAKIGKPETWVSRHLSLNNLSEYVLDLVVAGKIPNVEAMVNFQKIYEKNETFANNVVATLNDGVITQQLTREWAKRLKSGEAMHTDKDQSPIAQTLLTDEVAPIVEQVKLEQEQAKGQAKDQGIQEKETQKTIDNAKASKKLQAEYKKDILKDYAYLVEAARIGGERGALSKQLLINLAGKENASVNWSSVAKHADLLGVFSDVLERFKMCGYVSPSELNSEEIAVIIGQQELIKLS